MIELGALLGAIAMTLIFAQDAKGAPSHDAAATFTIVFLVAPVIGALWGAAAAAVIHFTADGTLPSILLGLVALALG